MKNLVEIVRILMLVAGVLCIGVGIMAVFLGDGYLDDYAKLQSSGEQIEVKILEKGTSRSAGNTRSSIDYFHIKYLGKTGKDKFSVIQAMPDEFKAYDVGSVVSVLYDPKEPRMAEIIKTPRQLEKIKQKPYKIVLFGLMLIIISMMLGKVYAKR